MKASKGYLFRACYSKGVSHCHLCFSRDSKAGRGAEKREGFMYALIGSCCHEEAVGRLGTNISKAVNY